MERLGHEFDAVGFYLSGHPLDDYMPLLARLGAESYAHFREKALKGAEAARLIGTVTYRQERRSSRSGNRFAFIGFSDPTGQFEAVCFADTLAACRDLLEVGKALILRVEADVDGEDVKLRLQGVEPLEEISAGLSAGLTIYLAGPTVLEFGRRRGSPIAAARRCISSCRSRTAGRPASGSATGSPSPRR